MQIQICTDCHLAHHGYTPHQLGYTPEPEPLLLVQDSITMWTDDNEPHFSWNDCQGCGSRLGGDRYDYNCEFV